MDKIRRKESRLGLFFASRYAPVMIKAMACGTPVVADRRGSVL
jgi:hypothetical protein